MRKDRSAGGASALSDAARALRQQQEIGCGPLFLEGLTRPELLARIGKARTAGAGKARGPAAAPARPEDDFRRAIQGWDYETLKEEALQCRRCALAEGRKQVAFSDGNPRGRVMVVGEGPGAKEDATGLPFVGPAGKLLDLLLASASLSRAESVYICNVVKCRPPGNRNPLPGEIRSCAPYLERQIELVAPRVILAAGTFAAHFLTGEEKPLGRLRGRAHRFGDIPVIVTYHPAAILRNPGWTRATWSDLQSLRRLLDRGEEGGAAS